MNADLTPALVALGGGSVLLGAIGTHEHLRDEAMRKERVRLSLLFPIGLESPQALAALDGLSGLPPTTELIAEIVATEGRIAHFLWVPASVRDSAQSILTGVIGSLRVAEAPPSPAEPATLAMRLFVPTPSALSVENPEAASRALLSGVANLRAGDAVVLRLALRPGSARHRREVQGPDAREREIERVWRRKTSVPGFSTAGLVMIRAPKLSRARELAAHIESVLRSRRGAIGGIRLTRGHGSRSLASQPRTTRTSGWLSTPELLALTGWPLGADVAIHGVEVGSRELLVPSSGHLPTEGRRLFLGRDLGGERWLALNPSAARLHTVIVGASGSGKSEMLARGILDEIAAGHAGAVIDPKADLVQTVLDHVPSEHADRVVVLDPGDDSRPTPGVAVLSGGDIDLRADVLTGAVRAIFADAWGVRSEHYLRLAIRSLSELPGATLADVGRLFSSEPSCRKSSRGCATRIWLERGSSISSCRPAAKSSTSKRRLPG